MCTLFLTACDSWKRLTEGREAEPAVAAAPEPETQPEPENQPVDTPAGTDPVTAPDPTTVPPQPVNPGPNPDPNAGSRQNYSVELVGEAEIGPFADEEGCLENA